MLSGEDFTSAEGALALYDYADELKFSSDPMLWDVYALRVESYISSLARNPDVEPLFELLSGVKGSDSQDELEAAVENFLSSPGAETLRSYPDAAPLFEALSLVGSSGTLESMKAYLEMLLEGAVEETIARYLDTQAADFVVGKTVTEDSRNALVRIQVKPDLPQSLMMDYAVQMRDLSQDFFSARGIQAEVSGETLMMKEIQDMSLRDGILLGIIAMIFIMLVLFLTFRKVLDVLLTLGVVAISMAWVFGLMGLVGIKYTIMSIAIIPLLLGIDIAYAIHVLTRYYEERARGYDGMASATRSVSTVGVAVFLTAATTMFGFLSFFISDMPPMRDFGILCLSGVFFSFLLSITLLPAALVIRDRRRGDSVRERQKGHRLLNWVDRGLAGVSMLAERHRRAVWGVLLVLVTACAVLASGLSTSADFRSFVPEDMHSYQVIMEVEDYFGGQDAAVALVEGDNVLSPDSLATIDAFIERVLTDPRNLTPEGEMRYFEDSRVSSIPTILAAVEGELPSSMEESEAALARIGDEYGFDTSALVTADHTKSLAAFDVFFIDEEGEKEMAAMLEDSASEISSGSSLRFKATGMPLIISDTLGKLFSTQLSTGGLALILCALLVVLVFRSVYYSLATTSVVFLAIVTELGILRLIGWPLDIMTVMIASMVIGVGIDFGVHVTHRFREEVYDTGLGPEKAINSSVRGVGTALIPAAVTTCGAFLILAMSNLAPLRRFGVITSIALLSALFLALIIQPTFLASIAIRKRNKALRDYERKRQGRPGGVMERLQPVAGRLLKRLGIRCGRVAESGDK